jgi:hypothetical protein
MKMYRHFLWFGVLCLLLTGCGRPEVYNMCTPSYASLPLQRGSDVPFQKLIWQQQGGFSNTPTITVLHSINELNVFIRDVLNVNKPLPNGDLRIPVIDTLRQIDYTQSVAVVAALGITPYGFRLDIQRVDRDNRVLRLQAKVLDCPDPHGAPVTAPSLPIEIISIDRANLPAAPFELELISNQRVIVTQSVTL